MNDKGLILFLRNKQELENSWIIVEKEALLREVCGTLFAPAGFKEHVVISSNTGVVPFSVLVDLFPHHKPEMLIAFLKFFHLCQDVDATFQQEVVSNLRNDLHLLSEECRLLFFPALVSAERPKQINAECANQTVFGWCLACSDPRHFFTPYLFHVLQQHLAFSFTRAMKLTPSFLSVSGFHRRCEVWKNGIQWWNEHNITTSVELVDQSRCIQVVMIADEASIVEFVQFRTAIICLILSLKSELCPSLDASQYLIAPSELLTSPLPPLGELTLFSMEDFARSLVSHSLYIAADSGKPSCIKACDLVPFEPYQLLQPSLISQLFNSSKSSDPLPDDVFHEVVKQLGQLSCLVHPGTHLEVQSCLNACSIFAGSNPFVSEWINTDHV